MKIDLRLFPYLFFVLLCTTFSCKKDDNAARPQSNCQLAKAIYFDDNGDPEDSLEYTYTGDQLTKMSTTDGYAELEYSNNKISKRTFFEPGISIPNTYDIFTYNADGSIGMIKSYSEAGGQIVLYNQYEFNYSNGKLVKFDVKEYNYNTGQIELLESSTYKYTGKNISESENTDFFIGGSDTVTYNYSYDSNDNYLFKNNAFFIDYLFLYEIDGSSLPLIFSAKNVIKVVEDADEIPINYKSDSNNNFYEFYLNGQLASRYLYDCK